MGRPELALLVSLLASTAFAGNGDSAVDDRLRALATDIRCLVCQNQSLADSDAPLAADLRREIRGMIVSGETDAEIHDYLVNRYGDFVLYRPPLRAATWLLWFGPVLITVGAVFMFKKSLVHRNRETGSDADYRSNTSC